MMQKPFTNFWVFLLWKKYRYIHVYSNKRKQLKKCLIILGGDGNSVDSLSDSTLESLS